MAERIPLLVVGAGPCGLAVGVAARQAGIGCVLLDRRNVVSTIERYPLNMTFFSTPERLEIGGVPFVTANDKPTRRDGLVYYRRVAERFGLDVRLGEEVTALRRGGRGFTAGVRRRFDTLQYEADAIVIATGYYDWPNLLGVPGEDLPHVSHYFTEGHRYWRRRVVVAGAGNSAVDAALECWRAGAHVTLVHFAEGLDRGVKPWVLPDVTNRIKDGSIAARWHRRIAAIRENAVELVPAEGAAADAAPETLPADAVLLMTGFHAGTGLLEQVGVPVDPVTGVPAHGEATMETPVPGCYIAGVIASGRDANRLFIENAREHGARIVEHLVARRAAAGGC